jgi:nitrogen regulatory protein P-II 1
MKEIKAYIQPHKLSAVTLALRQMAGLTGMSVANMQGFGRGRARGARQRIVEDVIEYMPRVKLEIFCRDDLVEDVIAAIEHTARTGLRGDGKIYVTPVDTAVRISSGERGEAAV